MKKETVIIIRIDNEMKKEIKKLAEKDSRTLSDYIRLQLKKLTEKVK